MCNQSACDAHHSCIFTVILNFHHKTQGASYGPKKYGTAVLFDRWVKTVAYFINSPMSGNALFDL